MIIITILNLIKQSKTLNHIRQIHAYFITNPLLSSSSSQILIKLLYRITTINDSSSSSLPHPYHPLNYAVSIFNRIQNPSTFCYNTIIRAHTLHSSPHNALLFFSRMRAVLVPPDFHSFPFVLKACSQLGSAFSTRMIHCQALKSGFASDLFVVNSLTHVYSVLDNLNDGCKVFDESPVRDIVSYNSLVDGYVKKGKIAQAREFFKMMPFHDSVTWGTLISGCVQIDQCKEGILLFNEMMELGFLPDNVSLVSALSACGKLGELEMGKRIHDYIIRNGIEVTSFLATGLVDLYAKCGYIETAMEIFEESKDKKLFTWNAMLVGLAMHGYGELLLVYFSRMVEAGIKPDGVTFLGVFVGCSHAGLVDEARKLFDEMEPVYGIPKELKHYGCMADLLARAGLIKEAMDMIKQKMPTQGDVYVWSGLLGGCRIHGNVEVAEEAAKHIMELKPEDGGVYKMMADVYANAERWEDVGKIRRSVDGNRGKVKKNAGVSLIQLDDGVVNEFVAGDRLHPCSDDIYLVLDCIGQHQFEFQ